jgi:hypothetical protein
MIPPLSLNGRMGIYCEHYFGLFIFPIGRSASVILEKLMNPINKKMELFSKSNHVSDLLVFRCRLNDIEIYC